MSLSKLIGSLERKYLLLILLLLVLIVSFILKINFVRDLSEYDDTNKDYLVAKHIVKYQEYLLTGPSNSIFKTIRNSPVYFYLLASPLFVYNDLKFLVIINIFLQTITILIIYFLAKELFSKKVGLLAAVIFGFSILTLEHVSYVWQPYVMQPFVNLSYILLILGYKKNNYLFLLLSLFIFIFSAAIHISVFVLAPIFIGILIWALIKKKYPPRYYLGVGATFLLSMLIFYLPLLLYLIKNQVNVFISPPNFYPASLPIILSHFWSNLIFFVGITVSNMDLINEAVSYIAFLTVLILSIYYFSVERHINRKKVTIFLLCIVGYLIFFISLLDFNKYSHHLYYYLTPVFGLFTIVLAEIIGKIFSRNDYLKATSVSIILIYLILFVASYKTFLHKSKMPSIFDKNSSILSSLDKLVDEINLIKRSNGYEDFSFFRLETNEGNNGWKFIPSYMVALEKTLNAKLTENSDLEVMSFRQLSDYDSKYIFLFCDLNPDLEKINKPCVQNFLKNRKEYYLIKNIYSDQDKNINLFRRD